MTDATAPANATAVPIAPILAERWSPRGFDAEYELTDDEVTALLEAARWSPSLSNTQPWKFIVARRGTPGFQAIVDGFMPFNTGWTERASALIIGLAETERDGTDLPWATFDLGQSAAHLTIQATELGLATRQMAGFHAEKFAESFELPASLVPKTVIAVGKHDASEDLPDTTREYDEKSYAERSRKPIDEVLFRPAE